MGGYKIISGKQTIILPEEIKITVTSGSNTYGLGAGDITWSVEMAKECG
jgi:hypothetical protein